jgi:SAM-dependent methyltransferase
MSTRAQRAKPAPAAPPTTSLRLNLGCGTDIRPGWVNVDCVALPGVDLVRDLNDLPLPFADRSATRIDCKDVLEHLDWIPVLRELHRILEPGGRLTIRVPHFTAKEAWGDPTHRAFFTAQSFRYFVGDHGRNYYFDFSFSSIEIHLDFNRRPGYPWNWLLEPLLNTSLHLLNFYEGSPLRLFPAQTLSIALRK